MACDSYQIVIKSVIQSIQAIDRKLSSIHDAEIFSPNERHYYLSKPNPLRSQAGLWCAKVAFHDAICHSGEPNQITPFSQVPPYRFVDIEIYHDEKGCPGIRLKHDLARWGQAKGLAIATSISHSGDIAAATVVLSSSAGDV